MPEKRLTCFQCPSYDRDARRCRIGKANPRKKHESITLAEMLGPRALCLHNPWREPLLLRMHQPDRRFVWDRAILPAPSGTLEVTILDEEADPDSGEAALPDSRERKQNG
jgi:hypothetical protein